MRFFSNLDQIILHHLQSVAAWWVKTTNLSSYLLAFFLSLGGGICALVCLGQDLRAGRGPWAIVIALWSVIPMCRSLLTHDRWKEGKTPLDIPDDFSSFTVILRVGLCLIATLNLLLMQEHWGGVAYFLVVAGICMSIVNSPPRQERRVPRIVPQTAC